MGVFGCLLRLLGECISTVNDLMLAWLKNKAVRCGRTIILFLLLVLQLHAAVWCEVKHAVHGPDMEAMRGRHSQSHSDPL